MDALKKVSTYLGITHTPIKVREWKYVYWVHVEGRKPTMLSKKMVDRAAFIKVGRTIAGDALMLDEKTGRAFIAREPGYYTNSAWGVKEIKPEQVKVSLDYSDVRKPISEFRVRPTDRPKTVRELMILKFCRNVGRVA